ncbi:Bug family tripartite tricarboxylate transporter substrate binding protein [Noviherbaspirillum suwonense]|jgi:tripartite-type tricarboxylate transporter receptor subunit TctC|uniref:Tripartite-type tricarboxylate transporter, receptor component TctC n=1 Tax=Noviherbaspirillum suwonense TaxID=1224511 RepID=A0ABY1QEJ5_9BURK|nr:tripartite tricarboxylate transporter substrate binding protein [Noviherbaspirillum suwonense]SMP67182.1 Tripartite-type tricarboxylate transporter, receptor component TctC [Noviherbaspirillum suwonense]
MTLSTTIRKLAIPVVGIALTLFAQQSPAQDQDWPKRPVNIIVGFSPGGTTDIIARMLGVELSKAWGQSVIVENRPGAGGNIAGALVAKAAPDGYTLFMGSTGPLSVNTSLYKRMPFDHLKDFTPISLVADVPNMLVVNPKFMPAATFKDFMGLLKANPGKYFYASTGSGTASHLATELLKHEAKVEATHVPYKGAVALNDLLAGDSVHFMFATIPSVVQHVRSGKLKALAVTSKKRSTGLPEIPTVAESGYPNFDASSWFGLVGPAAMPKAVSEKISADIARVMATPDMRAKFIEQGAEPVASTPAQFGDYMRSETAKWEKVVKLSGASAE